MSSSSESYSRCWEYPGTIVDITEFGCKFSISTASIQSMPDFMKGDLQIRFPLPKIEKELEVQGSPTHVTDDHEKTYVGIKFHELSQKMKDQIAEYIALLEPVSKLE